MKNEQIGIFINKPEIGHFVGICETKITDGQEVKYITFAQNKTAKYEEPLKEVKEHMIKKYDLKDFKSTFKDELSAVNAYNKKEKLGLTHLQILQITYNLNITGDKSDETIKETYKKILDFYNLHIQK